jgi:DNA-binding transcriptional regulator YiaG
MPDYIAAQDMDEALVTKVAEMVAEWERSSEQASDFARRLIAVIRSQRPDKAFD